MAAMALSRDRIVSAAFDVVAEVGLGKLSMRRVAAELDVEAMSLYRYVENKDDLLDAVHDAVVAEVNASTSGGWSAQVRTIATSFREVLFARPAFVPLLATRPASGPHASALLERGVGIFEEAGWDTETAVFAFQTVFVFVVGHAVFHTAGGELAGDDDWSRREFEVGLDAIIVGLAARQ